MKKLLKLNLPVAWYFVPFFLLIPVLSLANQLDKNDIPVTCSATSTDALLAFLNGREAFEMGRLIDASLSLERATQLDPHFALAYLYKAYGSSSERE